MLLIWDSKKGLEWWYTSGTGGNNASSSVSNYRYPVIGVNLEGYNNLSYILRAKVRQKFCSFSTSLVSSDIKPGKCKLAVNCDWSRGNRLTVIVDFLRFSH